MAADAKPELTERQKAAYADIQRAFRDGKSTIAAAYAHMTPEERVNLMRRYS